MLEYVSQDTWCVHYLLVRIKCTQETPMISRKGIIRLCTMRLTFSVGPYVTTWDWYWFINHTALITVYSCFTSQYEVQSVTRLAPTWHYYCYHTLLPLVAHTGKCAELFPAWINTLITVLYCAVQEFFFHLGFGHILFLCNNEPVIQNVPTILYIFLLHGTVGARNLLQHFGHFFHGVCILQKYLKLMLLVRQNTFRTSTNNLLCINYNTSHSQHTKLT